MKDEHITGAREMFVKVQHPVIGEMVVNGDPIKLLDMMPRIERPAPTLGQHNAEILQGMLGISDEELAQLEEEHVI